MLILNIPGMANTIQDLCEMGDFHDSLSLIGHTRIYNLFNTSVLNNMYIYLYIHSFCS